MRIFRHFSEFRIFRIQNLHARMHDCNMPVTLYARHVSYSRCLGWYEYDTGPTGTYYML